MYDGEVILDSEARHLESLLVQRLDRLETALREGDWLARLAARPSFARSANVSE